MNRTDPPVEWTGTGNKTMQRIYDEKYAFFGTLSEAEKDQRGSGRFWHKLDDIWDAYIVRLTGDEYSLICRPELETSCYTACYMHVEEGVMRGSTTSGSSSGRTPSINTDNNLHLDAFGNLGCDKAHLLPHADLCYKAYGYLAEAAVGKVVTNNEERLKILKGVKRVNNSSLKSHKNNKMFLKSRQKYFDANPSIIVIPILRLDEVKDWSSFQTGTSYNVMAVTFGEHHNGASVEVLRDALCECTPDEIDVARELLSIFLKGIACSFVVKEDESSVPFTETEIKSSLLLQDWSRTVRDIRERRSVTIPTRKTSSIANLHVAKARFSIGNSLPDPWLLTMKAAINFSTFYQQKLMPACMCTNSDSDSDEDFSVSSSSSTRTAIAFENCLTTTVNGSDNHTVVCNCPHSLVTTRSHREDDLCGKIIEFNGCEIDHNEDNNMDLE